MPSRKHPGRAGKRSRADLRSVARRLRGFALSLPEATEDFPWGERVAKVRGKVFVFLGADPVPGGGMGFSVKLPVSAEDALHLPFTEPTGYGLGKSGWVTAHFEPKDSPPAEILESWILESYRAVAPKKLVAELEAGG
ncbi:MAG: MmcQ/YjbR family DNA-binding protein [Thermoanaerobaculia bacterium]